MTCTKYGDNIPGGWAFSVCKCPSCQKENEQRKEHYQRVVKPEREALLRSWGEGVKEFQRKVSGC